MNQGQNNDLGTTIKVSQLDGQGSGYRDEKADDYHKKTIDDTTGVDSSIEVESSIDAKESVPASQVFNNPIVGGEYNVGKKTSNTDNTKGELDLTAEGIEGIEGVGQGQEYPKVPESATERIDTTVTGAVPEISKHDLAIAEETMAENLELLIKKQQGKTARDISINNTTDKLEAFMNTETTSIEKDTTPNRNEGVFGNAELSSKVTGIKEIKEGIIEIQKLLIAKEGEIQEVQDRIGVLGVKEGAATALVEELEEYKIKLTESNNKLREKLNELQELIQAKPEALTALRENSEAETIPEIKELLNSMTKVTPITEVGVDGALMNKDTTEAVIEKATGGLIGAIGAAMLKMDSTVDDGQVGEVFELFARGILSELKAEGMSHDEALAEYQAMVKALEASNGVIEIIRGEDGEMSAGIKNNVNQGNVHVDMPENFVDTVADDYSEQPLDMAV